MNGMCMAYRELTKQTGTDGQRAPKNQTRPSRSTLQPVDLDSTPSVTPERLCARTRRCRTSGAASATPP